ncbi:MAG: MFS transporter [Desulfovibrionaceae bacterium]
MNPLILIYGTAFISVMGISSILPVLPQMGLYFGLSDVSLGVLVISFTLPGIFLAPVGGILADRLGSKAVLVPCLILFAVAGVLAGFAESLNTFIFWRIVQGCGAACLGVLYNAIIADLFPHENQRLRIMGFAAMVLSMGTAIYPAVGGFLGEWGWRYPFMLSVLTVPLALVALLTPLSRGENRQNMQDYGRNAVILLRKPRILAHFLLTLCAFALLYGPLITYFPLLATTHFDASPSRIGSIFSIAALGTCCAAAFLGPLSHKLQARTMVYTGASFFVVSMLLFPYITSIYGFLIPVLLYGLGQGLVYPAAMTSLSGLAPGGTRGIVMAVNGTVLRLAQTIAPVLCGLLFWAWSFKGVFFAGALMGLCILYLTPRMYAQNPKNSSAA